jgi:flagellar basal-body rod protein FlgC
MNVSSTTQVSAMRAATYRLDVTAHNVANVNTRGFRARRAEQTEVAGGPDRAGGAPRERGTGTRAYDAGTERAGQPDLNKEMTDMVTERNTYKANARAERVRDRMAEETINLVG